jgi:hypothetical protein
VTVIPVTASNPKPPQAVLEHDREDGMRRIRITQERVARTAKAGDRYDVLPLDPRDPAILRAKALRDRDRSRPAPDRTS